MNSALKARSGPLTGAAYCVGALLIVVSLFDYAVGVWPFAPNQIEWRYGAVGLLAGYTLTPLLGGLILSVAAATAGHRVALRGLGIWHLVVALGLVLLIGSFSLDALQVRRDTDAQSRLVTEVGSARAAVKLLLTAIGAAWLGIAALRQARGPVAAADEETPELVVRRK